MARKKDPRLDAYIAQAAPFSRPILQHLRKVVHAGCPGVTETIKWGHPSFDYKGPMAGMAAFKEHCTFGFWKHGLVEKTLGKLPKREGTAWGTFGRITSVKDLPAETSLVRFVRIAAELNEQGVKVARKVTPKEERTVTVPKDLAAALKTSQKAAAHFDAFSYSKKKDYVEWLNEAKTDATRKKRLDTAVEWIAEGKARNWKYERK